MGKKLYAIRSARDLGKYYTDHLMAMTAEELHDKSDIAAELAYRDKEIKSLKELLVETGQYRRSDGTTC